jgi:dihydroflavonol-4-reductase
VEWVQADVRDAAALRAALAGCGTVFHLAARISVTGDPDGSVWETNVEGTRNVVESALELGIRRLVHCSSVNAFDFERCSGELDEQAAPAERPELPIYDRSKAAADSVVRAALDRGLDAVIAHPTTVIGPLDLEPSRMGRVLLAVARRRLPALVAGALDWVDVRDVCEGLLAAERLGRTGEGYLLGGEHASLRRLARLTAAANGVQPPTLTVPLRLALAVAPMAARLAGARTDRSFTPEALHSVRYAPRVSYGKAAELGYLPRPLEETAEDLVEWLVASGRLRRQGAPLRSRTQAAR